MTTASEGPDFICIGLQKAATGWLYDQLQYHPDFWMPPVKEFHYFDRCFPDGQLKDLVSMARSSPEGLARKRLRNNWRPLEDRDSAFFSDAEACAGSAPDLSQYASLFRHKNGLLSGDITPAYSTLTEDVVEKITSYFRRVKVILLVRDPIARVWSQICMSWRRGRLPIEILENPAEFRQYLNSPPVRDRSFPTETYSRWSRHVPEEQMRYFFFDHIISEPERIRGELLSFLGADPVKPSGVKASFNRKSAMQKLEMSDRTKQLLIEHFAREIPACAELFGGPAREWKSRYGL